MSASSQKVTEPVPIACIPSRWRGLYLQARSRRIEREHREEFQRFYASLPQKKDILYMFFTSGLLHWVSRALSFVPENVNVVLVGSDLQEDELTWIQENVRRPFHHIRLRVDDRAVWEFLFETNVNNFGWLDIDCFIFEPRLFREIVQIDPGVVANTVWSFQAPGGADMLCTFFVFLNVEAIRAVASEIPISPNIYTYEPIRRPASPYAFSSLLTPRHVELLSRVLPYSNG